MNADKVLKEVLLTEKANKQSAELGQYTFIVSKGSNKHAIAEAVEKTFKVKVRRVNTQNSSAKIKKAVVVFLVRPLTSRRRSSHLKQEIRSNSYNNKIAA